MKRTLLIIAGMIFIFLAFLQFMFGLFYPVVRVQKRGCNGYNNSRHGDVVVWHRLDIVYSKFVSCNCNVFDSTVRVEKQKAIEYVKTIHP